MTGAGFPEFTAALATRARIAGRAAPPGVALNGRHGAVLARVAGLLAAAADQVRTPHPSYDLLAADLREAVATLGEITGECAGEEILDRIFEQFCVGK